MIRIRVLLLMLLILARPVAAHAQSRRLRMVIGTHVACRARPDTAAPAVREYAVGDVFLPRDRAESPNGVWYLDTARVYAPSPGCWISGPLTTEWSDRVRGLIAVVDHILARTDPVPFEDYVAVDNLLIRTPLGAHSDSTVLEASPLLQLRRLQLLERAARAPRALRFWVRRKPLAWAWFLAHPDALHYHEPAGRWVVPASVFWGLYERYRGTASAEEIAWAAARAIVPGDECDALCVLDRLNRTYARYWAAFPHGQWVGEALATALRHTSTARVDCRLDRPERTRAMADSIRESLADVAAPGKARLIARLGEIERGCPSGGPAAHPAAERERRGGNALPGADAGTT